MLLFVSLFSSANTKQAVRTPAADLARMSARLKVGLPSDSSFDPPKETGTLARSTMTRIASSCSFDSMADDATLPSRLRRWRSDLTSMSYNKSGCPIFCYLHLVKTK